MFDTERLIREIERRVCLWKADEESYSDKEAKRRSWEEVCRTLYPDWDSFMYDERQQKVSDIQRKWKSVRDYYNRQRKEQRKHKGEHYAAKRRKYMYFEALSFLDNADNRSSELQENFLQQESVISESEICNAAENCAVIIEDEKYSEIESKVKIEPERELELQPEPSFEYFKPKLEEKLISSLPPKKRRKETHNEKNYIDEDRTFLLSLLPALKDLNGLQKMDFKLEIMNVLKRIKYGTFPYYSLSGGLYPSLYNLFPLPKTTNLVVPSTKSNFKANSPCSSASSSI